MQRAPHHAPQLRPTPQSPPRRECRRRSTRVPSRRVIRHGDGGVDRRDEVDGKDATAIIYSMAIQGSSSSGRPPLRPELDVCLHAIHPVHHPLVHADHISITGVTEQLTNRLDGDHLTKVADPGVKNALGVGEFVAWHFVKQVVGSGGEIF